MNKIAATASFCVLFFPAIVNASFFGDDPAPPPISAAGTGFETVFSTSGQVAPFVVKAIMSAKKSIRGSIRMLASKPVSEALIQAGRAGCDVKIIVDKKSNQTGYSNATFMQTMGNTPHVIKGDESLHLNYIVIDENDIVLGNIASLADADEEKQSPVGALVIHNAPELAKQYLANWQILWDKSEEMKKDK